MAGLNDAAWARVFAEPEIAEALRRDRFVTVSAARLKKLTGREPRLLAKHDFSAARPQYFQDNRLSILPLSRDSYVVGAFHVYKDFPAQPAPLKRLSIPAGIESLDFFNLSSEAVMLNAAALSGVLRDFVGGGPLFPTVTGRMSTMEIPLHLREIGVDITVDRAQMEIDGGFESAEHLVLVEAKNRLSPDFNIRQLYFPFRRFSQALSKPVLPVYVVYSNGIFHLYRYSFPDPSDFRSIRLEDSARYVLGATELTLSVVRGIAKRTCPDTEPAAPFPQADSFARVVSLLEMLPLRKAEIPELFGFTPRQADYYVNAGRYLGLMAVSGDVVESTGLPSSRDMRNMAFISAMARRRVFNGMIRLVCEQQRPLSKEEAIALMQDAGLGLGGTTLMRRASTVVAWSQWLWDLVAPRQLTLREAQLPQTP